MVWAKAGTKTLGSAGNDIDINNLTANKFNQFMLHTLTGGRTTSHNYRCLTTFDNNGASDYAWRRSANGGTDVANSSTQSQNYIDFDDGLEDACDKFYIIYGCNIDGEEKLFISNHCQGGLSTGAGTAPNRQELVAKVDTTTNTGQYTDIDINNDLTGSYDTDSNLSAIGSDGTASLNVQDGAIYYDTTLNKEYVLYNNTWTEV
jgi:hypothetical protein